MKSHLRVTFGGQQLALKATQLLIDGTRKHCQRRSRAASFIALMPGRLNGDDGPGRGVHRRCARRNVRGVATNTSGSILLDRLGRSCSRFGLWQQRADRLLAPKPRIHHDDRAGVSQKLQMGCAGSVADPALRKSLGVARR